MNLLIRKLEAFAEFDDDDRRALTGLCVRSERMRAGRSLIREGDRPDHVRVLLDGWACRHKDLPDGERQIVAVMLPGDICDVQIFILKEMDHCISLLSEAEVALIPKDEMQGIMDAHPHIARAFWWSTLVDEAILREWLVNIGTRDATRGVAHLFIEMWLRLRQVGLADGNSFFMPLTQVQLAETFALTTVHINRTLQLLRSDGLIKLEGKRLTILDVKRLAALASFTSNYLHLDRR